MNVYITYHNDRYYVVDERGTCLDSDDATGFATREVAHSWAVANGYTVL